MRRALTRKQRQDAAEAVYVARQLETIRAGAFEARLAPLKSRLLIPTNNNVGEWDNTYTYRFWNQVGMAKVIASWSDDLPRVDAFSQEETSRIKDLGDLYGYNVKEISQARATGVDLDGRKARTARRAIEEKIDELLAVGSAIHGILGFVNQPNVPLYVIADGAGDADQTWETKTNAEILADLHGVQASVRTGTQEIETADTIVLPDSSYELLTTRLMGDGDNRTLLQVFLATSRNVRNVESWTRLETAGAGGTKRMVCYRRDPDVLQSIIPMEFNQLAAQPRVLETIVPCLARCGGVVVYLPLAMAYADGI